MDKVDFRKAFKALYLPPAQPALIDVPAMLYACVDGVGDPNVSSDFAAATQALYALSYSIKMLPKRGATPPGYFDYTVFPLEGIWDMDSAPNPDGRGLDKGRFIWTLMIRQPEFVTPDLFEGVCDAAMEKKGAPKLDQVRLATIADGLSVQMMHHGPYDDEPASFALMAEFCAQNGLIRVGHKHREIYLSDPRRSAPDKMRTVLRYFVSR